MKSRTRLVFILTVIVSAITAMFCFPGNPDMVLFKFGEYHFGINYSSYALLKLFATCMWVTTIIMAYTEK